MYNREVEELVPLKCHDVTDKILGAAIEVHRALGPGLLESAYEACLCHELTLRSVPYERQLPMPVLYKGVRVECGFRLDLLVEKCVIVDLKAKEKVIPIDEAQLLTYMRLTNVQVGLIINFNVPVLRNGIHRRVL